MYCTEDCTCSLCRELRGYRYKNVHPKVASAKPTVATAGMFPVGNSNFILRRSKPELNRQQDDGHVNGNSSRRPKVCPMQRSQSVAQIRGSNRNGPQKDDDDDNGSAGNQTDDTSSTALKDAIASTTSSSQSHLPVVAGSVVARNKDQHKVIIYFGDSLSSKQQLEEAERLHKQRQNQQNANLSTYNVSKATSIANSPNDTESLQNDHVQSSLSNLPSFVESVEGNVINIRVEGSFSRALDIVRSVKDATTKDGIVDNQMDDNNDGFDWSFVQKWRSR